MDYYDLAIIGAGWAGFSAAVKAVEAGLKVCLIEKDLLGGTCLNRGCIPTKALIQSAKIYSLAKKSSKFGIHTEAPQINFPQIQQRKAQIVSQLSSAMQFTLKNKKVYFMHGEANIISPEELSVATERVKAKNILLATGSQPADLPGIKFDAKKIVSSDEILKLEALPKSILIIGGGVIGCEFASLFAILGTQVTITELMPQILPAEDKEVARKLELIFKKKGIKVNTNTDAKAINLDNFELVLLAVGRKPFISAIDGIGIHLERNGIATNDYLATNIPNIYAAGDCTAGIMLAHFAAYQGSLAAENLSGGNKKKNQPLAIPNCIFTDPEVASVGLSEDKAKEQGIEVKVNKFDFQASSMARILDENEGFIKVVWDKNKEDILGASIIGPKATELIGIFTLAIQSHLKMGQVKETIFAHPTLSESITECLRA